MLILCINLCVDHNLMQMHLSECSSHACHVRTIFCDAKFTAPSIMPRKIMCNEGIIILPLPLAIRRLKMLKHTKNVEIKIVLAASESMLNTKIDHVAYGAIGKGFLPSIHKFLINFIIVERAPKQECKKCTCTFHKFHAHSHPIYFMNHSQRTFFFFVER